MPPLIQQRRRRRRGIKRPRHSPKLPVPKDALALHATEDALPLPEFVIEYVPDAPDSLMVDMFPDVLARFTVSEAMDIDSDGSHGDDAEGAADGDKAPGGFEHTEAQSGDEADEADEADGKPSSKRKMRKERRLTVAELKQLVEKPEVVEWVDVCASDPRLLVELKSIRNVVPVPLHWSQKRKYLQNKRGIEKMPFELPAFIKATGIQTMRDATDKPDASLKQKTRERVQPKIGKLVIDYAKLHDAFFKWQTKPQMAGYGEVYYEGREFETRLKTVRPGAALSADLCEALGIPPLAPPPWLINMQRYGPPPSYPGLKIPGLNAPIPPGSQWGFHPGGWGKPPVDEYGRPLYGDVFGSTYDMTYTNEYAIPIERDAWGELPPEEEPDESDGEDHAGDGDEDLDEDEQGRAGQGGEIGAGGGSHEDGAHEAGRPTLGSRVGGSMGPEIEIEHDGSSRPEYHRNLQLHPQQPSWYGTQAHDGFGAPDGGVPQQCRVAETITEVDIEEFVAGLETPAIPSDIELRKTTSKPAGGGVVPAHEATATAPGRPARAAQQPSLYTVLPERKSTITGMMGSERVYDVRPAAAVAPTPTTTAKEGQDTPASLAIKPLARKEEKKRKTDEKQKKFKF